jgi:tetratricopeptide (TPR) repeat protein
LRYGSVLAGRPRWLRKASGQTPEAVFAKMNAVVMELQAGQQPTALARRTERVRVALARAGLGALGALLAFPRAGSPGRAGGLALVVAIELGVFALVYFVLSRRILWALANYRLIREVRLERAAPARRWLDWRKAVTRDGSPTARPTVVAHAALDEASVLILEQRYAEACEVLAAIDPAALCGAVAPDRLQHARNAWAIARDRMLVEALALHGDHEAALQLASETVDRARQASSSMLGYCLTALGIACLAAERHEQAISALQEALTLESNRSEVARRAFLLGDALRGLKRVDEAVEAYSRALSEGPLSPYGKGAAERLAELRGRTPYR